MSPLPPCSLAAILTALKQTCPVAFPQSILPSWSAHVLLNILPPQDPLGPLTVPLTYSISMLFFFLYEPPNVNVLSDSAPKPFLPLDDHIYS